MIAETVPRCVFFCAIPAESLENIDDLSSRGRPAIVSCILHERRSLPRQTATSLFAPSRHPVCGSYRGTGNHLAALLFAPGATPLVGGFNPYWQCGPSVRGDNSTVLVVESNPRRVCSRYLRSFKTSTRSRMVLAGLGNPFSGLSWRAIGADSSLFFKCTICLHPHTLFRRQSSRQNH